MFFCWPSALQQLEFCPYLQSGQLIIIAAGNALKCAESALKLEERRRQIYQEVAAKNASLGLGSSSVSDNKSYQTLKL